LSVKQATKNFSKHVNLTAFQRFLQVVRKLTSYGTMRYSNLSKGKRFISSSRH